MAQVGKMSLNSTTECLQLFYEFLVGEPPKKHLSKSTLNIWHQDISRLNIKLAIKAILQCPVFGILADEST